MPALQATPELLTKLNTLVADAVIYYYKLHNYHWFVSGPRFDELHKKFEELYDNAHADLDLLAERVLSVGGEPVGTLAACLQAGSLDEASGKPSADQMLEIVIADLKARHAMGMAAIKLAEAEDDRGTANLLDELNDRIEKDLWMLEASRAKGG